MNFTNLINVLAFDAKSILEGVGEVDSSSAGGELVQKTVEFGTSGTTVMMYIGLFVAVIAMIIGFLKLMTSNTQTRGLAKADIGWIVLAVVGLAGTVGIVGWLFSVGGGLFS